MDSLDNHPIPQDVTHFQFRLIGDMTIKQFGYLAGGLGLAWFVFAVPFFILIKIIFVPGFAFLGILLAFIPIEGRPADLMLSKFFKALFIPNQFIFQKTSGNPFLSTLTQMPASQTVVIQPAQTPVQTKEHVLLQAAQPIPSFNPTPFVQPIKTIPVTPPPSTQIKPVQAVTPMPKIQQPPITQPVTTPSVTTQQSPIVPLTQANQINAQPSIQTQPAQTTPPPATNNTHQLEQKLNETMTQKQELEKQLQDLRQQLANPPQAQSVIIPASPLPVVQESSSHVKKIPPPLNKTIGAPMAGIDVPNLITGIIKDSRGNVLPNILIEVKDKEGNPVRAFKTNQLGQFASATPLLNGVYTVLFEDTAGKHKFDTIELTVDGTILLPIEITSIDQREELRKELFG